MNHPIKIKCLVPIDVEPTNKTTTVLQNFGDQCNIQINVPLFTEDYYLKFIKGKNHISYYWGVKGVVNSLFPLKIDYMKGCLPLFPIP